MKFQTLEEQLNFYKQKRIKKQTLESYFLSAGFQYMEPEIFRPMVPNSPLVKVIGGKGDIYTMRGDMTEGIISQLGGQAIESEEIKLYYDGKIFINSDKGGIKFKDQMGVEWIGGHVFTSTQELIKLSAQTMMHRQEKVVVEISHIAYFMGLINKFNLEGQIILKLQELLNSKNLGDLEAYLIEVGADQACIDDFKELLSLKGSWQEIQERLLAKGDAISKQVLKDLLAVEEGLKTMEANGEVYFDLSIVPRYNYYTGVVFKGFSTDNYKELISGGQYVIETAEGRRIEAVGFSIYESALQ